MHDTALFSVSFHVPAAVRQNLPPLRKSIDERRRLHLEYLDGQDRRSDRTVRPLGLYFWGNRWTLGAWCELRQDFRNFRVDRIATASPLDETFELVSPVTLDDYLRSMTGD
jgi:predicted DNA-binding transcriptional regulator YafY